MRALLDAYRGEAARLGRAFPDFPAEEQALRLMESFCLHRVVKSLGRSVEKGFDEQDVSDLLDHGERLRESVFR